MKNIFEVVDTSRHIIDALDRKTERGKFNFAEPEESEKALESVMW